MNIRTIDTHDFEIEPSRIIDHKTGEIIYEDDGPVSNETFVAYAEQFWAWLEEARTW